MEYRYLTAHAVVLLLAQARALGAQQQSYAKEAVSAIEIAPLLA